MYQRLLVHVDLVLSFILIINQLEASNETDLHYLNISKLRGIFYSRKYQMFCIFTKDFYFQTYYDLVKGKFLLNNSFYDQAKQTEIRLVNETIDPFYFVQTIDQKAFIRSSKKIFEITESYSELKIKEINYSDFDFNITINELSNE